VNTTVAPSITATQPTFHPLVKIFPEMEEFAFAELVADIKANGIREPITIYKNQILDGRNRWRACQKLGIACPQRAYEGKGEERDLRAFVVSKNLHRRHLNTSQRAMIAAEIADMTHGGDRKSDQAGKVQLDSVSRPSRTDAAQLLNVSPESVTTAKKVADRAEPEVAKAVKDGKITVSAATKILEHPAEIQRQAAAKIASGAKPADVVRALPASRPKAKPSAPAPPKPSREQKKAWFVYAALTRLEDEWAEKYDGDLGDYDASEFWPLLGTHMQEDVVRVAKALLPWLEGIIAQAKKTPAAIVEKPKLVTKSAGVQ
jgi:ParB-like chromosome segregation protein Spo0J